MTNPNKQKGTRYEVEVTEKLNEIKGSKFKRVVGSGAIGTTMHESSLMGDVKGELLNSPHKFKIECKARTGATQFQIKKEWLDKIAEEAKLDHAIPLLACKFLGSRSGVRSMIVMDIEVFIDLMNLLVEYKEESEKVNDS